MLVVVVLENVIVPSIQGREKILTVEARNISSLNVNTFYVFVSFLAGGTTSLAQRRWHNVAGTTSLAQAAERFLRHGIDFDEFLYHFNFEIFEH